MGQINQFCLKWSSSKLWDLNGKNEEKIRIVIGFIPTILSKFAASYLFIYPDEMTRVEDICKLQTAHK